MTAHATNSQPGPSGLLSANTVKADLVSYLHQLKSSCGTLSREQVVIVLGQWFHPLHYFPNFLSRLISIAPSIETKTFISRILWQELGEGEPANAHERIYIETIHHNGFVKEQVTEADALTATRALVEGYKRASENHLTGLGFLYGTEVVDLPMVATVGELMKRCTGKHDLPWVNVHVAQEPDHIDSSNKTLQPALTDSETNIIVQSAEDMWRLWIGFFKSIREELLV